MGNYIELLRGTLVIVSHAATFYIFTNSDSHIRHPARFWILLSILLEIFVLLTLFPFGMTTFISAMSFLIFLIAYTAAFIIISDNRQMAVFVFFLYAAFFMLAASTANLLSKLFFGNSQLAMIIIRMCFSILFIIALIWKLKAAIIKATEGIEEEWNTLIVFSLICCLGCASASLSMYFTDAIELHIVILSATTFLFISAFVIVLRMIRLLNERNDARQIYQQQKLLERELETEEEFIRAAKRYRHDIRHHLSVLRESAEDGDIESIKRYLNESEIIFENESIKMWCENKTMNSLLRLNAKRCENLGIRYTFNVILPNDIPISGPELTSIFGNLLENAIDNTSSADDSFVICSVKETDVNLFAEVRNRKKGKITWHDELPVSTKKEGGIGLKSVRFTVENRNGMFKCYEEDDQFIVQLVIPLQK